LREDFISENQRMSVPFPWFRLRRARSFANPGSVPIPALWRREHAKGSEPHGTADRRAPLRDDALERRLAAARDSTPSRAPRSFQSVIFLAIRALMWRGARQEAGTATSEPAS
jgi:hypothetical protein